MAVVDEPIQNLEQAKRYFIAMGCSHFHLSREDFQRRDEYYALNISTEVEKEWPQQEIERCITQFPFDEPEKIGWSYRLLVDMVTSENDYIEQMLFLANNFIDTLPPNQINIVLGTIIGRNAALTHGGLIEDAFKASHDDIAQQFEICAKKLIEKAENNSIAIQFLRGYLIDVIRAYKLQETDEYLNQLRERDDMESFSYYLQGAEEGDIFSMKMLAKHYEEGKGCDIDKIQAKYWIRQANQLFNH